MGTNMYDTDTLMLSKVRKEVHNLVIYYAYMYVYMYALGSLNARANIERDANSHILGLGLGCRR